MGGLFTIVGLGFSIGTVATWRQETVITAHGSRALAAVVLKDVMHDDGAYYHLSYTFRVESGKRFDTRRRVSKRFWNTVAVGDTLPVRYDPVNPASSLPDGDAAPSVGAMLAMTIFSLVFAAFGAILAIAGIRAESAPPIPQESRVTRGRQLTRP